MRKIKDQKTSVVKGKEIKRKWHFIDAKGKIVGRLATQIATLLMGKNKVNYMPNLDQGDFVVVQNAAQVKFSGLKAENKKYYHHTGYPKGLRERTAKWMFEHHPTRIIWQAVKNMLPKNKLRKDRLARLRIYPGDKHPYEQQFKKVIKKD